MEVGDLVTFDRRLDEVSITSPPRGMFRLMVWSCFNLYGVFRLILGMGLIDVLFR